MTDISNSFPLYYLKPVDWLYDKKEAVALLRGSLFALSQAGSIGGQIWANISTNLIGYRLIIFSYSSSGFLSNTFVLLAKPFLTTKKFSIQQLLRILRTIHSPLYLPLKMVEYYENSMQANG